MSPIRSDLLPSPVENVSKIVTDVAKQEEAAQQQDPILQAHFEQVMMDKSPGHRNVAVLMLSWEKEKETDMDTSEEVKELHDVFRDIYGFSVREKKLKMSEGKAKTGINYYIAEFIHKEDNKDTLLIIYYAGHGAQADVFNNGLALRGGNRQDKNDAARDIVWDKVETHLADAKADMLLIFDCCYAARVGNRRRHVTFSNQVYEVLGACQADELTMAPGPDSFTRALIWALKGLASPAQAFTTSQLYERLLNAPPYRNFQVDKRLPRRSHPYWSEKAGHHTLRRLKITPKDAPDNSEEETNPAETKYSLSMSFALNDMPDRDEITRLCAKLKEVMQPDEPQSKIHQVLWRGLYSADKAKVDFPSFVGMVGWKFKAKKLQSELEKMTRARLRRQAEILRENIALSSQLCDDDDGDGDDDADTDMLIPADTHTHSFLKAAFRQAFGFFSFRSLPKWHLLHFFGWLAGRR